MLPTSRAVDWRLCVMGQTPVFGLATIHPESLPSSCNALGRDQKKWPPLGREATRIERCALLTFLLVSPDSQHTATYRSASSSTCRSSAHYYRKAFPSHRCPYL